MTERQRLILAQLRHGGRDHYQIAADLIEAPFIVRAELKAMKRDRLVREKLDRRGHTWELTPHGEGVAWSSAQLKIESAR